MTADSRADDPTPRLLHGALPPALERWRVALAPGTERPTDAAEWAGALVVVESGRIEVGCMAGGHRTFVAGDMLALGWLPLSTLRNPGRETVRLVAVRRRGQLATDPFLDVNGERRLGSDQ